MGIKDIITLAPSSPESDLALSQSLVLAHAHSAHVTVLVPAFYPAFPVAGPGVMLPELYADLAREAHESGLARAEQAKALLTKAGVRGSVRVIDIDTAGLGARATVHAWYSDLIVVSTQDPEMQPGLSEALVADLLTDSGRPLLVVPKGSKLSLPFKKVALAWWPSRHASRAVHDALPLIKGAQVRVLVVDPHTSSYGAEPGADIATHLAHHGLDVQVETLESKRHSVGETLIEAARAQQCDLLVMGGYSHARWRELLLGGATLDILRNAPCPLLMAH
jgi:nucleotide-binding universal stress UspA family protein